MQNLLRTFAASTVIIVLANGAALADITVNKTGDVWKIDAQNEPLTGVLSTVSKKAGIKVSGTAKLVRNTKVTGLYEGDLNSVLRRILRGTDYAFETVADEDGTTRITRLIVLSGIKGKAPSARAVSSAKRLPATRASQKPTPAQAEQAARVTTLLNRQVSLLAPQQGGDAPTQTPEATNDPDGATPRSTGITRNTDGSFDITPEAQARMAEATRRAQQDLQALVAAVRRNENNTGDAN